jgi:hypothetical protein
MYLQEPTYASVSALILGYDLANEGGVLIGFREWLIARLGLGNNLTWSVLVLHAAFPNATNPQETVRSSRDADKQAIETLFELVAEFDHTRSAPDGLRKIFLDYEAWLRRQSWYTPKSPHWIDCPVPANQGAKRRPRRS